VPTIADPSKINRAQVKLLQEVLCEGADVPVSRFPRNDFDRQIGSPQLVCGGIHTPCHSVFFDSHACARLEKTAGLAS